MIPVDTSVCVDHLRRGNSRLADLLERNDVVMHPFIAGEIACGSLTNRRVTLELLQQLPMSVVAEYDEVLGYVERHGLHGKGIGYVDVHLLASAVIENARIWTLDKRLGAVAQELECALRHRNAN